MLTITKAQFATFREIAWRDFKRRLKAHLVAIYPDRDPEDLAGLTREGIALCRRYAITRERHVIRMIELHIDSDRALFDPQRFPLIDRTFSLSGGDPDANVSFACRIARKAGFPPVPGGLR